MDTFEIDDEEINVEEIMQKIRENIKKRKESKDQNEDMQQILRLSEENGLSQEIEKGKYEGYNNFSSWLDEIRKDLDYINKNWDIQNNSYFIGSHHPLAGRFLIKGREIVNGEVRRYVDPMIWKQNEFNASTVRILNENAKKIMDILQKTFEFESANLGTIRSDIVSKVDEQIGLVRSEMGSKVDEQIERIKQEINDEISDHVKDIVAAMNQEIENRAWLANILDRKISNHKDIETSVSTQELGINYFIFEERFRGSRAEIKQRQKDLVPSSRRRSVVC